MKTKTEILCNILKHRQFEEEVMKKLDDLLEHYSRFRIDTAEIMREATICVERIYEWALLKGRVKELLDIFQTEFDEWESTEYKRIKRDMFMEFTNHKNLAKRDSRIVAIEPKETDIRHEIKTLDDYRKLRMIIIKWEKIYEDVKSAFWCSKDKLEALKELRQLTQHYQISFDDLANKTRSKNEQSV